MKLSNSRKHLAVLAGSAFVGTLSLAGLAQADDQPLFVTADLQGGYLLAKGDDEATCGEGKCGEGSCGEGKGAHVHAAGMSAEAKCGEGKCGEGSCGEGKGAHVHSDDDSDEG